jgi:uncharacterized caspase-like protein
VDNLRSRILPPSAPSPYAGPRPNLAPTGQVAALLVLVASGCASLAPASHASRGVQILPHPDEPSGPHGPRLALVVGNQAYRVGALESPRNDATAIAARLGELGFEATLLLDTGRTELADAISRFGDRLAQRGGLGLFYYAGHGLQVDHENYLVPVDARLESRSQVGVDAVPLAHVLSAMGRPRTEDGANVIILDACRNDPFPPAGRGGTRGLALLDAPPETVIAFATSPGGLAAESKPFGLYTGALLRHLGEPGLPLSELWMATGSDVKRETREAQRPWVSTDLTDDVVLGPPAEHESTATELHAQAAQLYADGDLLAARAAAERAAKSADQPLTTTQRDELTSLAQRIDDELVTLVLEVEPTTAMLSVDGKPRFSVEGRVQLNPGRHVVRLSDQGYAAVTQTLELERGARQRLSVVLQAEAVRGDRERRMAWVLGGASVGLVGGSLGLAVAAASRKDRLDEACPNGTCDPDVAFDWRHTRDSGRRLERAAWGLAGLGVAAGAGALLMRYGMHWLGLADEHDVSVAAACDAHGCEASARTWF